MWAYQTARGGGREGGEETRGSLKEGCSRQRKNLGMFREQQRADGVGVSGGERGEIREGMWEGAGEGPGVPGRSF